MALCSVVALQRERRFIIYLNQRLAGNGFNESVKACCSNSDKDTLLVRHVVFVAASTVNQRSQQQASFPCLLQAFQVLFSMAGHAGKNFSGS